MYAWPYMPADDDTLTIAPLPASSIQGITARSHQVRALEVHVDHQVPVLDGHEVGVGEPQDAGHVAQDWTVTGPAVTRSTTAARDAGSRDVHGHARRAVAPSARDRGDRLATPGARSRQATRAPSAASRYAVARPMPPAAPVTTARSRRSGRVPHVPSWWGRAGTGRPANSEPGPSRRFGTDRYEDTFSPDGRAVGHRGTIEGWADEAGLRVDGTLSVPYEEVDVSVQRVRRSGRSAREQGGHARRAALRRRGVTVPARLAEGAHRGAARSGRAGRGRRRAVPDPQPGHRRTSASPVGSAPPSTAIRHAVRPVPTRGSKERRLDQKRRRGETKATRRRPPLD